MLERGFNLQHREIKHWQRILNDGQIFLNGNDASCEKLQSIDSSVNK